MKITLLPSATSRGEEHSQFLTSFIINDTIALDAGSLGFYATVQEQARVNHVLLSHSHLDHLASLPIFVENIFSGRPDCVTIHGSEEALDCLRRDLMNDRVWPDLVRLSSPEAPFLKLSPLQARQTIELEGLRITPVAVDHAVPTFGFLMADQAGAVLFSSDTGPTEEIWALANQTANLKAVFLEASFPDAMKWLANRTGHLTPALFAAELAKLQQAVPVIAVHIKARYRAQIISELMALGQTQIQIGESGAAYSF